MLEQDPISTFLKLDECPNMLNVPLTYDKTTDKITRLDTNMEKVEDLYSKTTVNLKKLVDQIFY
jgi:hypothetical protein